MEAELKPLPCPFCGMENSVGVQQGSTFRWVAAYCGACEAKGPEERREKYTGEISDSDRAIALEAWNRRPSVPQRERRPCEDTCELSSLLRETEAQERRLAEALTKMWQLSNCQNPAAECPACQAINRGEWLDKALCEARAILAAPPDPKASEPEKDPMLAIECAIGGACHMPDGRRFWIDGPVARELTRRVAEALNLPLRVPGKADR